MRTTRWIQYPTRIRMLCRLPISERYPGVPTAFGEKGAEVSKTLGTQLQLLSHNKSQWDRLFSDSDRFRLAHAQFEVIFFSDHTTSLNHVSDWRRCLRARHVIPA